mgnify:FL=1
MARIGVEPGLTNVKEALQEMGHEVVDVRSEEDAAGCDSVIISGMDQNMMGISDTFTEGPVINAEGASVEEVCQLVNNRLR